jgi:hypothetical protein
LFSLTEQAPEGIEVEREMTIRLDEWNRPEPDLLANGTLRSLPHFYTPEKTLLVVEVVSPESAHRDRTVKLRIATSCASRRRSRSNSAWTSWFHPVGAES